MTELADRIEAATGPSRELDEEIWITRNIPPARVGRIDRLNGVVGWWPNDAPYQSAVEVPRYTASLDAAMTLVPEGWTFINFRKFDDGSVACDLEVIGVKVNTIEASAATPALALCAAALRARGDKT